MLERLTSAIAANRFGLGARPGELDTKGVMEEHLLIPSRALEASVFPDSGGAKVLRGLVRT